MSKYISLDNTVEVIDSLLSDKSGAALSAKQGKVLKNKISNISTIHIKAGKNIKAEYKGNVCTISYDGSAKNKYNDKQIDYMLTNWQKKQSIVALQ